MTTPVPTITPLPVAPSRDDSINFSARADAFVAALPPFGLEANALAGNVYGNAVEALNSANAAASSATAASNSASSAASSATAAFVSAGATIWVSGTTYALGAVVWSPANGQIYRRIVAGAGTTDPSADLTNWKTALDFSIGTAPNEIPINQYLGSMAFQDVESVVIDELTLASGTGNGLLYLNASKKITSGSAITYNGTTLAIQAAAIFNEAGENVDFRIEGDTVTNLFFLDASGDHIGIGQNPDANRRLCVRGIGDTNSTFALSVQNNASPPQQLLLCRDDGLIGTGTEATSPYNNTTADAANMNVNSDGHLRRSTSSLRYKTDVTDARHGLADVMNLRSVTYRGINDGDKILGGLIAEEVDAAGLTEFVAYDGQGRPDAIHYGNMIALLVKAVQELKAELDELKGV